MKRSVSVRWKLLAAFAGVVAVSIAALCGYAAAHGAHWSIVIELGALIAVVGLGLGLAVGGALARSIDRLTEAADRIAETGDLTLRIEAASGDELGRLAAVLDRLVARLR